MVIVNHARKELKEKIDSNSNSLNELNKKLNENSKNLSNLKQRINKLNEKRSKIEQGLVKKDNYENRLKELNEELENYQKEKEQFENIEIVEVEERHFNDFELKSNLRNNREKLNRITSEVSVINNELDKIKEKEKEYDDLNEKNKKNIKVYNRYGELQKAWSKDGIQALIIDTTLPLIEAEINNYLNIMSAGEISIKFETQKEAKNGNISETLDIIVSDFSCSDRKYELFKRLIFEKTKRCDYVPMEKAGEVGELKSFKFHGTLVKQDEEMKKTLKEWSDIIEAKLNKIKTKSNVTGKAFKVLEVESTKSITE